MRPGASRSILLASLRGHSAPVFGRLLTERRRTLSVFLGLVRISSRQVIRCRQVETHPARELGHEVVVLEFVHYSRRVRVVFDIIEWENGLDLDPEYLYERGEPVPPEA